MWRNLAKAVRDLQRTFEDAVDPYRPELHYMRGPGPKCLAKHADPIEAVDLAARKLPAPFEARV
jgi:hypothetical protein